LEGRGRGIPACLETEENHEKNLFKISSALAEIRTQHLSFVIEMSQDHISVILTGDSVVFLSPAQANTEAAASIMRQTFPSTSHPVHSIHGHPIIRRDIV
jgi:hypothetical protein